MITQKLQKETEFDKRLREQALAFAQIYGAVEGILNGHDTVLETLGKADPELVIDALRRIVARFKDRADRWYGREI